MKKDYKKLLKDVYAPRPGLPTIVRVPGLRFLMVDGKGHPGDGEFGSAAATLMPVAYVSKFILKARRPEEDFTVMPMEVKWRLDRTRRGPARYAWTMMVMQPDAMAGDVVEEALEALRRKRKTPPLAERLRLGAYEAGLCGQILHVGPYGEPMERSFDALKAMLAREGYDWEPDSQDVYFNDARRCSPEKLRTLTRVRVWMKGTGRALEGP